MVWFIVALVLLIAGVLAILFLNRFYKKATREVALIRTGAGGQRVVLDGGCIAVPFLHKVSEVNMKTTGLEIERLGPKSIITKDRLRVDAGVEFYIRVQPTKEGVATAAQALAGKSFRASELAETLEGKLVDALLSVAARYTMDELQDKRGQYAAEVTETLAPNLAKNGLLLESVSLKRLDQTPFHALDENNAFNALGMRRLAEIITVNKKERAAIEAAAEVAVRQSQLDATKKKLLIEQEEEQAQIEQHRQIETTRAVSQADIAEQQASAELRREHARITREREVRGSEIARDRALRSLDLEASLATEQAKVDKAIVLAAKRVEEAKALAKAEGARAEEVTAQEAVDTARSKAVAERERQIAVIRAAEQADVDSTRVKSETGTLLAMAQAEAKAMIDRAKAEKDQLIAKAEGTAALIGAENSQSPDLIRMKLDMARLDALPEIVARMMKPAEKIESIRINTITGFGTAGPYGPADGAGAGTERSAVNQVVDGVLSMALQLPAVKKLGEEVGLNVGEGLKGLSDSLSGPPAGEAAAKPQGRPARPRKTP
ncbi:MAG TPA: flotillin domain-containing protein [Aestuariivirgaceae bacterium]|nr:flotillin domain-containing protein [Aestuariivirgaceae bacterium]